MGKLETTKEDFMNAHHTNIHYLETSAINVFADEIVDFNFNNGLQRAMKIDFCISSIGLWEILLNGDPSRKERLIFWTQFNCVDYLLKTPAEIVISYLEAGLPLKDRKRFWFDRASTQPLAETWKRIHGRRDRTILVEYDSLMKRTEPIRELGKMQKKLLDELTEKTSDSYQNEFFHQAYLTLQKTRGKPVDLPRSDEKLIKAALILTFFLVCIGIEPDNSAVEGYWESKGIVDPLERLNHFVTNEPLAIIRGPIIEMALMVHSQAKKGHSTNRGTMFDAMHAIYCYYADNFVSHDPHFVLLKELGGHEIYSRIISADSYLKLIREAIQLLSKP